MKPKLDWWAESCDLQGDEEPSGAKLRKATCAPAISNVIYHEQPFCSADGSRIAVFRTHDARRWMPGELLVYDINRYALASLLPGAGGQGYVATDAWSGLLFVAAVADGATQLKTENDPSNSSHAVWCVDLNTLECRELPFACGDLRAVSAGSRHGLFSHAIGETRSDGRQEFGVFQIDLESGDTKLIYRSCDICNPHLQYRRGLADRILIQENRDWRTNAQGVFGPSAQSTVGLCSIATDGSDRREFPIGGDHTPPTTGHECWIGETDRALVTLNAPHNDGKRSGCVLEVCHDWQAPRVVFDSPAHWNHIAASRCGKYFVADCYDTPETPLLVGNIETGKTAVLCHATAEGGGAQHTHAHPYFTSDNQWVVFNSDRTGITQIYLARVPDGFLKSLD